MHVHWVPVSIAVQRLTSTMRVTLFFFLEMNAAQILPDKQSHMSPPMMTFYEPSARLQQQMPTPESHGLPYSVLLQTAAQELT
ncbi:hypothetical protein H2248_003605 [Termitomyces sp. 'cryptogamus']|nr:hypothetical protein H2248_003605 [Termitomyces sp. 'cryptogamus']